MKCPCGILDALPKVSTKMYLLRLACTSREHDKEQSNKIHAAMQIPTSKHGILRVATSGSEVIDSCAELHALPATECGADFRVPAEIFAHVFFV